ncbi:hypothetical protein [Amycolatopsis taiwanensis]|uniref:Uncharacterized protein n=1 Tax=Amycolatopsis taiwanensis TaxID=342230 RepID=A0A9W6R8S6_9PSEU|nr:hypothetical protein [Amycolatopsis taiwanensis]GLY71343.1 hypothetical protein Atai01_79620 [Amycolatopsis taiwanensis]
MTHSRFEEQRRRNLERARRSGVPDSVAQLFATVQEPRCDDEPSTSEFDAALKEEGARLKASITTPSYDSGMLFDTGGIGGTVETEATASARRLLSVAESNGMEKTASLLRAALEQCDCISTQRDSGGEALSFPEPERIVNPETGRPIGMWR